MVSGAPGVPAFAGSKSFSDVTVRYSGREFKAHKVILAAKSGWFNDTFQSKSEGASVVELGDDDPEILERALRFIYDDHLHNDTHGQELPRVRILWYLALYEQSNKYDIPSLGSAAAEIIYSLFERCSLMDVEIAHVVYNGLSQDHYAIRGKFVETLCASMHAIDWDMEQFIRNNNEFAADIVVNIFPSA